MDLDPLEEFLDIKAGILKRAGIKDISAISRQMGKGSI
jgi:hypothetical protein